MPHNPDDWLDDIQHDVRKMHWDDKHGRRTSPSVDLMRIAGSLTYDVTQLRDREVQFLMEQCSRDSLRGLWRFCDWTHKEADDEIAGELAETLQVNFGFE